MFLPKQQDTTIITSFKNLRLRNLLTFGGEKAFVGAFNNIYHQTLAQQRCCDWAWDRSPDPWPSSIIIALQLPGPPPFYPQSCPIINTDTHGHTLGFGTEAQWRWHPTPGRRVSRSIKMFLPVFNGSWWPVINVTISSLRRRPPHTPLVKTKQSVSQPNPVAERVGQRTEFPGMGNWW